MNKGPDEWRSSAFWKMQNQSININIIDIYY